MKNKFGVPYHAYTLYLDNGEVVNFDMAWEETWGDVNKWNSDFNEDYEGSYEGYPNEEYIGYGNDVGGYRKIERVFDEDNNREIDPFDFYAECEKWVDNYSA